MKNLGAHEKKGLLKAHAPLSINYLLFQGNPKYTKPTNYSNPLAHSSKTHGVLLSCANMLSCKFCNIIMCPCVKDSIKTCKDFVSVP